MAITTRADKGSELTHAEVDTNWTDLVAADLTKQDTLVSGTNIKTVGGVSLLGSGNVPVAVISPLLLMGA